MSTNLHCEEVALWQTPTHITNMCYSKNHGGWRGILYRYSEWVKSHKNGVYTTAAELRTLQIVKESIADHLQNLEKTAKDKGKLTFSVM
jgi:hypothetical protein